jgi:hypothetical protein
VTYTSTEPRYGAPLTTLRFALPEDGGLLWSVVTSGKILDEKFREKMVESVHEVKLGL